MRCPFISDRLLLFPPLVGVCYLEVERAASAQYINNYYVIEIKFRLQFRASVKHAHAMTLLLNLATLHHVRYYL